MPQQVYTTWYPPTGITCYIANTVGGHYIYALYHVMLQLLQLVYTWQAMHHKYSPFLPVVHMIYIYICITITRL